MAPPPLMEELEEEVLLRFPPHEPALLLRAALVCKRWRRLVSGPAFRRRFRDLHRTPPMLGFLCNLVGDASKSCFVPAAGAFRSPGADLCRCVALDARHGRVLLQRPGISEDALVVWDPISDEKLELSTPVPRRYPYNWTAAVLCAAGGTCDHLDCHRGPFLLVYVGSCVSRKVFICTYSSDAGTWSELITAELPLDLVGLMASVLVGNALYFGFPFTKSLLKYDLESHEISVIGVPHTLSFWRHVVLDGGLALATVHESKLCIWRKTGHEEDAGWTQDMVIELETKLPRRAILASPNVVGFADGTGVIFLRAGYVLFTIDLKTYQAKKVFNGKDIYSAILYMSFYTPALGAACTDEG
ncbi:unnamed protein product [Urochloa decumbens]|uniref:F-box domain-containing protein n=1 Tax=Urochloa decumbens TaxID=240449 RepID=A0ABC9F779_9POAL